jgi:colicin import membrane protein
MLEKELAQATKMAESAHKKVDQLRKKLVSDSEKAHVRIKRELVASRKRHKTAKARLKSAKVALRKKSHLKTRKKLMHW